MSSSSSGDDVGGSQPGSSQPGSARAGKGNARAGKGNSAILSDSSDSANDDNDANGKPGGGGVGGGGGGAGAGAGDSDIHDVGAPLSTSQVAAVAAAADIAGAVAGLYISISQPAPDINKAEADIVDLINLVGLADNMQESTGYFTRALLAIMYPTPDTIPAGMLMTTTSRLTITPTNLQELDARGDVYGRDRKEFRIKGSNRVPAAVLKVGKSVTVEVKVHGSHLSSVEANPGTTIQELLFDDTPTAFESNHNYYELQSDYGRSVRVSYDPSSAPPTMSQTYVAAGSRFVVSRSATAGDGMAVADSVVFDSKSARTFMWVAITLHIGAKGRNGGHYVCARLLTRVDGVSSFVVLNDDRGGRVENSSWQGVIDSLRDKAKAEIAVTSALYMADTGDDYKGRASHGVSNSTSTRCYAIASMQMLEPILNVGSVYDGGRDDSGGGAGGGGGGVGGSNGGPRGGTGNVTPRKRPRQSDDDNVRAVYVRCTTCCGT